MGSNLEFRILEPGESALYRALRLESLIESPDSFCTTFEIENAREKLSFQKNIEDKAKDKFIVGCFEEGNLIGICGFYTLPEATDVGGLVQLYVKKGYRRKGLAKQLMIKIIEKAFLLDKVKKIQLGVLTENKSITKLYKDLGFKEYDFQKAVLMKNNRSLDIIHMELNKQ